MPGKLIITHGLPGSGKSTIAKEIKAQDPEHIIIVERDEVRTALFGDSYHKKDPDRKAEAQVTQVCEELTRKGLKAGKTVINSDTNVNPKFLPKLFQMAKQHGAEVEQIHVDTPVEECKRRNRQRGAQGGRLVPEHVIDAMAKKAYDDQGKMKRFVYSSRGEVFAVSQESPGREELDAYNKELEEANPMVGKAVVFVDVDSTLANNTHHSRRYLSVPPGGKKDFESFFQKIEEAPVNDHVVALANQMRDNDGLNLVVLTGRDDKYAKELISFLKRSGIKASKVLMKHHGDFRPDGEFKHEVIKAVRSEGLIPVHAIDDRPSSIRSMEKEGILVTRVLVDHDKQYAGGDSPDPSPEVSSIYGGGYCLRCGSPLKQGNIGPKCKTKA